MEGRCSELGHAMTRDELKPRVLYWWDDTASVREALYGRALAATNGSRRDAAKLLGVAPARVAEALRDFPALAERWPAGPRGPRPRDA